MASYISVPRDLSKVKTKVFMNLTKRQILCFGAGALIGVPVFFLLKSSGNLSLAALGMMAVMLPLFFLAMYEKSGVYARAVFLKAHFFGQPFRVLVTDRTLLDYCTKLSAFHAQYRMVGNNYNQTVRELRCHFSEKKAMALLYRLEKCTGELAALTQQVMELSREFEERWSRR